MCVREPVGCDALRCACLTLCGCSNCYLITVFSFVLWRFVVLSSWLQSSFAPIDWSHFPNLNYVSIRPVGSRTSTVLMICRCLPLFTAVHASANAFVSWSPHQHTKPKTMMIFFWNYHTMAIFPFAYYSCEYQQLLIHVSWLFVLFWLTRLWTCITVWYYYGIEMHNFHVFVRFFFAVLFILFLFLVFLFFSFFELPRSTQLQHFHKHIVANMIARWPMALTSYQQSIFKNWDKRLMYRKLRFHQIARLCVSVCVCVFFSFCSSFGVFRQTVSFMNVK